MRSMWNGRRPPRSLSLPMQVSTSTVRSEDRITKVCTLCRSRPSASTKCGASHPRWGASASGVAAGKSHVGRVGPAVSTTASTRTRPSARVCMARDSTQRGERGPGPSGSCMIGRDPRREARRHGSARRQGGDRHRLRPRHRPARSPCAWCATAPAVVVNDLDDAPAQETIALIEKMGGRAVACNGDVTAKDFGDRIVDTAVEQLGGLHVDREQRRLHLGQRHPEDDRRAVVRHHRRPSDRAVPHPARLRAHLRAQFEAERTRGKRIVRKVVNISSTSGVNGNAGQVELLGRQGRGIVGMTRRWPRSGAATTSP